jgi:hypothetical protein
MCPKCKQLLREYLPNTTLSWSKNKILFCIRCRAIFDLRRREISGTLTPEQRAEILQSGQQPF